MKPLIFALVFAMVLSSGTLFAQGGEDLFRSLGCGVCHKPETGKISPSLKTIARFYDGKEKQLVLYLNGEAEPIVSPEKGDMMKRYVEKTKQLKEGERESLADFLLSHGK